MAHAVYMSEAHAWWDLEKQRKALANSLPGARVYVDELHPRDRQGHAVSALGQRKVMLRTTTRKAPLTIIVASLAVLGWKEDDIREVLETILAREWTLISLEDGATFGHDGLSVKATMALWLAAKTKSRIEGAAKRGGEVTKERKEAEVAAKIEPHRHLWGHPGYTANEVLKLAGVSRNTMNKHMGQTWQEALRANRERFQRIERKAARKSKEAISDE
jgi:hypothetical protein